MTDEKMIRVRIPRAIHIAARTDAATHDVRLADTLNAAIVEFLHDDNDLNAQIPILPEFLLGADAGDRFVAFHLSRDQYAEFVKLSKRRRLSVSSIVRIALARKYATREAAK